MEWIETPAATPLRRGDLQERIPVSRNASLYAYDRPLGSIELPAHLRYRDEPLTPGELDQLRHRLDRVMVGAWCVFSVLFVTILAASVWLLRVAGA